MNNILITGGSGFIGYHLAKKHVELGDSVIIIDNLSKTNSSVDNELSTLIQNKRLTFIKLDLTEDIESDNFPQKFDVVYHLAAINGTKLFYDIPYELCRNNILITIKLLDFLKKIKVGKIIYTSSSEVYAGSDDFGLLKIPTTEEVPVVFPQPTDRRFSYGTSKFIGEFLSMNFGAKYDVPVAVVRFHNIYGPRMGNKHVIPEFIERANNKKNIFAIYGGENKRSFCYVDDAIKGLLLLSNLDIIEPQLFHIGNPKEEIKIKKLAQIICDKLNKKTIFQDQGAPSSSVSRRCPDISKMKNLTGFNPNIDLDEGLEKTIKWYQTIF
jgi:nucleoside-diphosphate-sugar epimerase